MLIEAVLTFFLVNTVLHTAVAGKGGQLAGVAIGMTLAAAILVGGPMTGASLNPARTLGTSVYAGPSLGNLNTYVIYLLGPFIGATVAALLFNLFMSEAKPAEVEAAPSKAPAKAAVKPSVRKSTAKAKK
jgi:glycerol uptake facilitator-like aquaporin